MCLNRTIDNHKRHGRDDDFRLCDFPQRSLGGPSVDFDRGVEHDEAGRVDFAAGTRDPVDDDAVGGELFAKGCFAGVVGAGDEVFEGAFGGADGAHGVVDAAGSETALDDFEAAAFAEDHCGGGDADVCKGDVAVAVGGVVVAVDGEHAFLFDAGGGGRDEHDGLLLVAVWVGGGGFAHDDVDCAAGVAGARGPPFLSS